jgi:hypothetical protein
MLGIIAAAQATGLDAVIVSPADGSAPTCVDVLAMDGDRVAAAMSVRVSDGAWRYEIPARPGGAPLHSWRMRYLGELGKPVTAEALRPLDHWLAKAPGTGREPVPAPPGRREDTPGWMRPGYWQRRLGRPIGGSPR